MNLFNYRFCLCCSLNTRSGFCLNDVFLSLAHIKYDHVENIFRLFMSNKPYILRWNMRNIFKQEGSQRYMFIIYNCWNYKCMTHTHIYPKSIARHFFFSCNIFISFHCEVSICLYLNWLNKLRLNCKPKRNSRYGECSNGELHRGKQQGLFDCLFN